MPKPIEATRAKAAAKVNAIDSERTLGLEFIRATNPPWLLQRMLFAILAPAGRLLGYRPDVPYAAHRERPSSTAA